MERIWVVEMQCNEGRWWVATKGSTVLACNNFYSAHIVKRVQYLYLKSLAPKIWTQKRLRVRQWNAPADQGVSSHSLQQPRYARAQ